MTLIERARQWGRERDQEWFQKGIERGIEQGIERGFEKGIERGRTEGERAVVCRQISSKFGPGTAEQLRGLLDRISDPEDMACVADAVIDCETTEEFLERVRGGLNSVQSVPAT